MNCLPCCWKKPQKDVTFSREMKNEALQMYSKYDVSTQPITMHGTQTWCRVVDVIDGDSIMVLMPYKNKKNIYKFAIRLSGIDACEMNSKLSENRYKAVKARDRVIQLVTGINTLPNFKNRKEVQTFLNEKVYVVWIECYCMDKYKRVLADVYPTHTAESISNTLVKESLAYTYHGKTKLSEEQQLDVLAPVVP